MGRSLPVFMSSLPSALPISKHPEDGFGCRIVMAKIFHACFLDAIANFFCPLIFRISKNDRSFFFFTGICKFSLKKGKLFLGWLFSFLSAWEGNAFVTIVNIFQKRGSLSGLYMAVHPSMVGFGEKQVFFRPGQGHIKKPPLFFYVCRPGV